MVQNKNKFICIPDPSLAYANDVQHAKIKYNTIPYLLAIYIYIYIYINTELYQSNYIKIASWCLWVKDSVFDLLMKSIFQ
jgi:hypothetical protein